MTFGRARTIKPLPRVAVIERKIFNAALKTVFALRKDLFRSECKKS